MFGEVILWVKLSNKSSKKQKLNAGKNYFLNWRTVVTCHQEHGTARPIFLRFPRFTSTPTVPFAMGWEHISWSHSPGAQTRWAFGDWLHSWTWLPCLQMSPGPGMWPAVPWWKGEQPHMFSPSKNPFYLLILGEDWQGVRQECRAAALTDWAFCELYVFI